jgi:hypothetical protein
MWSGVKAVAALLLVLVLVSGCGSQNRPQRTASRASSASASPGYVDCSAPACVVPQGDRWRYLNVVSSDPGPTLPYLIGETLRLGSASRTFQLVGYDSHGLCSSLLRSPDGRLVIYGTSEAERPALAMLDLSTGRRALFRTSACDAAWGADDRIAYVRYSAFDAGTGVGRGKIVVQHGLSGTPQSWSGEGAWGNLIWAGDDLLANDAGPGDDTDSLVILRGPGSQFPVVGPSHAPLGPFSTVIAVNPHGTEALIDIQRLGAGGSGVNATDSAALLRVSDNRILSAVVVNSDEARNKDLAALAADGSWSGDEIITTDGIFWGGSTHPPPALVTLTVHGNRVRLDSAKPLLEHGVIPLGEDLLEVSQASFLDSSGHLVALWLSSIGQLKYLACNTATDRCTSSRNYLDPYGNTALGTAFFVSNPSRP